MSEFKIPSVFMTVEKPDELAFQKALIINPAQFTNKIVFVNGEKSNYIVVNGTKHAEYKPVETFESEQSATSLYALKSALSNIEAGVPTIINVASSEPIVLDSMLYIPTGADVVLNIVDTEIALKKDAVGKFGITVVEGASLTVRGGHIANEEKDVTLFDNKGTLKIESGEFDGNMIVHNNPECETNITGGNFTSQECIALLSCADSVLNISGGEFTAIDNAAIMDNGNSGNTGNTITVTGGKFNCNITSANYIACGVYVSNDNFVYLYGGEFNVTNGVGVLARAGNTIIDGAKFNVTGTGTGKVGDSKTQIECAAVVFDAASNYPNLTDEDCIIIEDVDITTESGIEYCVMTADGHKHNDAIVDRIIKPGVPVVDATELVEAITVGGQIVVEEDIITQGMFNIKQDTVIDMGGCTLIRENVTTSGNQTAPVIYSSTGKLTLTNGSIVTDGTAAASSMTAVWAGGADIEILDGTYKGGAWNVAYDPESSVSAAPTIYATAGFITIKGGEFVGAYDTKGFATVQPNILNILDSARKNGTAGFIVMGGKFKNFNPANNVSEGVGTNFVSDGYKVVVNGIENNEQWTPEMGDVWYEVVEA